MFISAFIGGIMLSFASHGADYMMVQRVLATKNVRSAQKAMKKAAKKRKQQETKKFLAG